MTIVAELLKAKDSSTIHRIGPDATVYEAVEMMAQHRVGSVLVIEGDKVLGIVTERDYARKIALMDRSSRSTKVREVMSSPVMCVPPSHTTEECMALMTKSRLRHLPVMDNGKLVGLVSIGDLVSGIISEQRFIIDQLEQYIAR